MNFKDAMLKNKAWTTLGVVCGLLTGLANVPSLHEYSDVLLQFAGAIGALLGVLGRNPSKE